MRVLRSHGSISKSPSETLISSPKVFTPSVSDLRPKKHNASTNSSPSSIKKPCTRLSIRLSSVSPPTNVSDIEGAGKRNRSAGVSCPGCSSDESEKQWLHLRSGLRICRRRLSICSAMVGKEENEMAVRFKGGGSGDVPEEKTEIATAKPEVICAEREEVCEVADRHIQEEEKVKKDMHRSSPKGGYMTLRSRSQKKQKIMHGHVETKSGNKDVDKLGLRKIKLREELTLGSEHIDKSGDQMSISIKGMVTMDTDRGRCNNDKKKMENLAFEEDQFGMHSGEVCLAVNSIDDRVVGHFSNDSEMEGSGSLCGDLQDQGLGGSTFQDVVVIGRSGIDLNADPVSEEGLNKEMLIGDSLIPQFSSRRYSSEEKGKDKLIFSEIQETREQQVTAQEEEFSNINRPRSQWIRVSTAKSKSKREVCRDRAIQLAPQFAFFKAEDEKRDEESEVEESLPNANEEEDWPGPFSTAMKIIKERESMLKARSLKSSLEKDREVKVQWTPSNEQKTAKMGKLAPSLKDLCVNVLYENVEEVESLECLPDAIKHKLVNLLCHSRRMSSHVFGLLVKGSPSEICISDCSWATDKQFEELFSQCNISNLKVLQLNLCGRCLPDYVLHSTLAKAPNCLPSLSRLSLKGAYGLSDGGLAAIIASAPWLQSVDLSQCSLLTHKGITYLADKLEAVLKELYIADCQNVDAMLILPALQKVKCLEVLSVACMESVTDKFLKKLLPASGSNMRELTFSGCCKLTNASMKAIAENCPQLCCLNIRNLNG
ncbi:hypothetical protein HPP92_003953 [Vanilla planifolia]|uniref:Uncharacterized protein n=1 Tax=Vanilla planifolia TaxID=51239 RepID=A0A835SCW4_VANPL|nr:hypothetical protein HPP92_003953 [Vanilla planifolia]